jgi:hypothetical protein
MSILEASNFRVTALPNGQSVSVLYKPTRRRYTYTAINDRTDRSGRGVLASGCYVDRGGMDFSVYDDSEIQRHARRLALAAAKRLCRTDVASDLPPRRCDRWRRGHRDLARLVRDGCEGCRQLAKASQRPWTMALTLRTSWSYSQPSS